MTACPSPAYASSLAALSPPLGTQTTAQVRAGPRFSPEGDAFEGACSSRPYSERRACHVRHFTLDHPFSHSPGTTSVPLRPFPEGRACHVRRSPDYAVGAIHDLPLQHIVPVVRRRFFPKATGRAIQESPRQHVNCDCLSSGSFAGSGEPFIQKAASPPAFGIPAK